MDKEQLAHEYALKALAEQISELEKAFLHGYNEAINKSLPIDIEGVKYYDFGLPSGTLWSMPLFKANTKTKIVHADYNKASLLNIPTIEQFQELKEACRIESTCENTITYVTPLGKSFFVSDNKGGFWTKSEVNNYKAIAVNKDLDPIEEHVSVEKKVILVKNKNNI